MFDFHQFYTVNIFSSSYRAKQFLIHKRNIWVLIFKWNGHMFRFIAKIVFPQNIGKNRNDGNYLIAHVQYIGLSNMAAKYAYTISMFQAKSRKTSGKFESVVTSTQRDLGGQERFRDSWEKYCRASDIIVFVVDSVDLTAMNEAKSNLHSLLEWPSLEGIPLLILGNKNDIDGALTEEELIEELSLRRVQDR